MCVWGGGGGGAGEGGGEEISMISWNQSQNQPVSADNENKDTNHCMLCK